MHKTIILILFRINGHLKFLFIYGMTFNQVGHINGEGSNFMAGLFQVKS